MYEARSDSFFALESLLGFTFRSFRVMKCVRSFLSSPLFPLSFSLSSYTRSYHKRKLIKEAKSKCRMKPGYETSSFHKDDVYS